MSDLRVTVEGLRAAEEGPVRTTTTNVQVRAWNRALDRVLELIPEGAVLVTEETLAAAITATHWYDASSKDALHEAAAILRHLREAS